MRVLLLRGCVIGRADERTSGRADGPAGGRAGSRTDGRTGRQTYGHTGIPNPGHAGGHAARGIRAATPPPAPGCAPQIRNGPRGNAPERAAPAAGPRPPRHPQGPPGRGAGPRSHAGPPRGHRGRHPNGPAADTHRARGEAARRPEEDTPRPTRGSRPRRLLPPRVREDDARRGMTGDFPGSPSRHCTNRVIVRDRAPAPGSRRRSRRPGNAVRPAAGCGGADGLRTVRQHGVVAINFSNEAMQSGQ